MLPTLSLRSRILAAIGIAAVACTKKANEPDAAPADAALWGPPAPSAQIPEPRPATREMCLTRAEVLGQLQQPPGLRIGGGVCDGGDCRALLDSNGCAQPQYMADGCCNPAVSGPVLKGDKCCYLTEIHGCCGRPFLIDGVARVATSSVRSDWLDEKGMPLPRDDRLATVWLAEALAEHASIASFARFTLDLLAIGAPAELVLDAQRAGLDEIEHARACFAIASELAGRPLGPGPLDVTAHGGGPRSLASIVLAAFEEGCIGETSASLLASRRAAEATHPRIRATRLKIAEDEARHAELAWRFVAWALDREGPDLRPLLRERLEARATSAEGFDLVIRPCAEALFGAG